MFEIIIKGRGGQGAKTVMEILCKAANYEDKFFLGYPEFGPERSGTPISAYLKLDDLRIRSREPIRNADIIVVLDRTLDKFDKGLKKNGILIVNSAFEKNSHFVNADEIAETAKSRSNMAMLGALIKITKILKKENVEKAIRDSLPEENVKCFDMGFMKAQ